MLIVPCLRAKNKIQEGAVHVDSNVNCPSQNFQL